MATREGEGGRARPRVRRASVRAPEAALPAFAAAFAFADAVATDIGADGRGRVEALFVGGAARRGAVEAAAAVAAAIGGVAPPRVAWEELPDRDWVAAGLAALPAARAGRFRVRGARVPARPSLWELRIEAAAAFGSGHHETTRGCLLALDRLARARSFARPLDLGCGTGALALAMARLWRRPVLAVDTDPEAAAAARGNARRNGLGRLVDCRRSEGFAALPPGARYDLIAANLLAAPLAAMAPELAARLAPGGVAVLSGILRRQARAVLAAYRPRGLAALGRRDLGEWSVLCLRKRRARPASRRNRGAGERRWAGVSWRGPWGPY